MMDRDSYFSERIYLGQNDEIDTEVYAYWEKILGKDVLDSVEHLYGSLNSIIDSSEYKTKDINPFREYESMAEQVSNANGKQGLYVRFPDQKLVFSEFFVPLINLGINDMKKNGNVFLSESVIDEYSNVLLERLGRVSLSTLMFEMYLCKQEGYLNGDSPEEEYDYYNEAFLGNTNYKRELFKIYPCLLRTITETIHNLTTYFSVLLTRLENDKRRIVEKFCAGKEFDSISAIQSSVSDSHKKGNGVSVLTLSNNIKIVYKPRSMKIETVYLDFMKKINEGCKYKMYNVLAEDVGDYGWEEYISYKSCSDTQELHRYFYRFGVLIFSSHILNINDLHEENLIACGEYPVIIDAETILDNRRRNQVNSAKEEINYILHESVLHSGLLPHYRFSKLGKGVDMSAIKGAEGEEYPIRIPKIVDICTSNMRFEYKKPVTHSNKNLAKLGEKVAPVYHFLEDINAGFRDAYTYVLNYKSQFITFTNRFGNLNVRHLVQDTQRYSMLLHTSYHPDFMQDGRDRQLFLCSVLKNYKEFQGDIHVPELEIKDMLNMDIPYFYLNTSETALYGSEGECIENYFENTSLCHLQDKIHGLCEEDMKKQQMFMDIILSNVNEIGVEDNKIEVHSLCLPSCQKDNKVILKAVLKLADNLMHTAIFNSDKSEVNWIGVSLIGSEDDCAWDIRPLGTYLYEGVSGLAIFFKALNSVIPKQEYKIISDAIAKELFTYTDEMLERKEDLEKESSGAFGGEASIMYTYEILYLISKEEKYLEYARKHFAILKKAIMEDANFDIVYGNSGAIIVLINMYHLTNDIQYLESAIHAGELLIKAQIQYGEIKGGWISDGRQSPLAGLSHGISGMVLALVKLWDATKRDEFLNAAIVGIKYENSLFVPEKGNWKDERVYSGEKASDRGSYSVAWCHGAAGILLNRVKIYTLLDKEHKTLLKDDIREAVKTVVREGILGNNCLCHGNLGNTEILEEYLKCFSDEETMAHCITLRQIIAENICREKYDCNNAYLFGYKLPGFMTGLSGMGYSMLRDINSNLPCILALDI